MPAGIHAHGLITQKCATGAGTYTCSHMDSTIVGEIHNHSTLVVNPNLPFADLHPVYADLLFIIRIK